MFNAKRTTNNVQVIVRNLTDSLNCQSDFFRDRDSFWQFQYFLKSSQSVPNIL